TTALARPRANWSAIWAGVFTFAGIWFVFGVLGYAIFASAASSEVARMSTGASIGMSIWAIVLTIIAMYVAGRETGRLAAVSNRHDGLVHGMIMFGLSVVAAIVLLGVAETGMNLGLSTTAHTSILASVNPGLGWAEFLALFFGWLAAMGGASTGARRRSEPEQTVQPIRPAA
ncbi:MAG: hypothetical protein ACRD3Q_02380, partial [Terriglobales bacterium]